jgi:hypothetical protein
MGAQDGRDRRLARIASSREAAIRARPGHAALLTISCSRFRDTARESVKHVSKNIFCSTKNIVPR